MARLALVPVAPQQAHEVFARAAPARAARQVDEQREMLAPQQLGRRVRAIDGHARGPEHAAVDVGKRSHGARDYRVECGERQAPLDSSRACNRRTPQRSSMPSGSATRSWASSAPAVWGSYTGLGTAPWATSSR